MALLDHDLLFKKVREARRMNTTTVHPNLRKYARCEWKCIAR